MTTAVKTALALVAEFKKTHSLPTKSVYRHVEDSLFLVEVVPIEDIEPFTRGPGVVGLDPGRVYSILEDLSKDIPIHAVNVYRQARASAKHRFQLYHGFHRYHVSMAVGFTHIPVAINSSGGENAP